MAAAVLLATGALMLTLTRTFVPAPAPRVIAA
eukprot:CAMPEP_0170617568 /NCGR_PEP_ID=MMETSP0224-20130122/26490_1 /TAXON_ID=285029 /ORGANISM="Togula jolla, Strain CCCM 725" /LENGTH=31 /DNA_ID= /DNA_START= /DNA_END= /DNA_ORIENTATION=